jgi:hypothetical protein
VAAPELDIRALVIRCARAVSSAPRSSSLSFNSAAFEKLCICTIVVALAIGAVTLSRAMSHASATSAGFASRGRILDSSIGSTSR